MYIRTSALEKYGDTAGCEACAAVREGRDREGINHSEHCRNRVTEAMKSDAAWKVRLERESRREEEYIVRVQEAEEKRTKRRRRKGPRRVRLKRPLRELKPASQPWRVAAPETPRGPKKIRHLQRGRPQRQERCRDKVTKKAVPEKIEASGAPASGSDPSVLEASWRTRVEPAYRH